MCQCDATMARLNLRIPDSTMVALRHELVREREFRGRRYSMNDLCVRKLAGGETVVVRQASTSSVSVSRVPPPPPVPMPTRPVLTTWTAPRWEEPQPERTTHAAKEPELVVVTEELAAEIAAVDVEAEAVTRMADEGGPSGNVD